MIKIADFGLSREDSSSGAMTWYVVTRPYRAPEVMLTAGVYTSAIDVWSAGCIMFEIATLQRLFKAKNCYDQVRRIVALCHVEDTSWLDPSALASSGLRISPVAPAEDTLCPPRPLKSIDSLNEVANTSCAEYPEFEV